MTDRPWQPDAARARTAAVLGEAAGLDDGAIAGRMLDLVERNAEIHDRTCINLNPATNVMNPAAEALLARGLGTRPSLGPPGAKYEMGLEAIEEIEILADRLAREVFGARFAEIRAGSGALANLAAFMACCAPGDRIIVPPPGIGGHVTHHDPGAAGLYGLEIHHAPVAADAYTIDAEALARQAAALKPRLITVGASLNLTPHPVPAIAAIAAEVGARVLFDAAHVSGLIAGGVWPNPLDQGADLMTMSTYKSLGGPAGGLIVTNDAGLAERLDAILFPGLTANFDVARTAALALGLLDWRAEGPAYAREMQATARALAAALAAERIEVFVPHEIATRSHQFAVLAAPFGGGQAMAERLRRANLLTSGIGLPVAPVAGDMNGLRLGTPEIVRRGMTAADMGPLAALIARALREEPEAVAADVTAFRARFQGLHFLRDSG